MVSDCTVTHRSVIDFGLDLRRSKTGVCVKIVAKTFNQQTQEAQ